MGKAVWPVLYKDFQAGGGEPERKVYSSPIVLLGKDGSIITGSLAIPRKGVKLHVPPSAPVLAPFDGKASVSTLATDFFRESPPMPVRHYFISAGKDVPLTRYSREMADGEAAQVGQRIGVVAGDSLEWYIWDEIKEAWIDPVDNWGARLQAGFLQQEVPPGGGGLGALAIVGGIVLGGGLLYALSRGRRGAR